MFAAYSFTLFLLTTLTTILHQSECYRKNIINGLPTSSNEFKYIAYVEHNEHLLCTAGIIGETFILTVAHCLVNKSNIFLDELKVVVGVKDATVKNDPLRVSVQVEKAYIPRTYDYHEKSCVIDDIAVLKLKEPLKLEYNEHLEALNLPGVDACQKVRSYEHMVAQFAGYGWNKIELDTGSTDYKLLKAHVQITDALDCLELIPFKAYKKVLCGKVINYSGNVHQGTCKGDSGGPLVTNNNTVIGVLAVGSYDCNTFYVPDRYMKVSAYMEFIENAMNGCEINMRVQEFP